MKRFVCLQIAVIVALLYTGGTVFAEKKTWNFDPAHSKIQFTVSHMMISSITGEFTTFGGKISANEADFSDAELNVSMMVRGVNTGNDKRDNSLRSEHFFDMKKHPAITFKSTSLTKIDDKNFKLVGDFTIRGVTKSEELNMFYGGTIKDHYGHNRAGFKVTGKINRFDYGLKWNELLETGGAIVGETVDIVCNVEVINRSGKK